MNILKQLQIIAIHDGGLPVFEPMKYLHCTCTCTTVTSLYISKNSVFISPHKHSNTVMLTIAGRKNKRPNQLTETRRFHSRHATVLAYMLTGQRPREATFQSNQAGLQIIFLHTYSETNLPPQTCRHGHNFIYIVKTRRMLAFPNKLRM